MRGQNNNNRNNNIIISIITDYPYYYSCCCSILILQDPSGMSKLPLLQRDRNNSQLNNRVWFRVRMGDPQNGIVNRFNPLIMDPPQKRMSRNTIPTSVSFQGDDNRIQITDYGPNKKGLRLGNASKNIK